jgi:hypothetical protein
VIAGNGDGRRRDGVEEGAGGGELVVMRALRQVAAHRDEMRLQLGDVIEQRLRRARIVAAEMQIRDMRDFPHCVRAAGARTCRLPGRLR